MVSTDGDTITVTQGQLDGAKQSYPTVCKPKNVGRSNETTGAQQAELEAASKHAKKLKAGYSLNKDAPIVVQLPQKVKIYQEHMDKIDFENGAYESKKLNGVNGTYRFENGELILYSRGGEVYPRIPHLELEIMHIMDTLNTDELNGELYIHGEYLQDITSAVKKPKALSSRLQFHVFELPNVVGNYGDHLCTMEWMNLRMHNMFVFMIPAIRATSHEGLAKKQAEYVEHGYEGMIIRNISGTYVHNERSVDVFKFKIPKDKEFQVIGYEFDKNGHTVFECEVPNSTRTVKAKVKGTKEERAAMSQVAKTYLGKWLKIEFEMYSKDKVPQKPVGIMFRECDAAGEPVE